MILAIAGLLPPNRLADLLRQLEGADFASGGKTAGWHARLVKSNLQAEAGPAVAAARRLLLQALEENVLFAAAALPRRFAPPLFSRYEPGMAYGSHTDDAVMGRGEARLRSDLSYTLFLSPPESYEGGELVIESRAGEEAYKLAAGDLLLYPSTSLHRVAPVTSGVRLVAVGWVQSLVREAARREILFDLEEARRAVFEAGGKSAAFDLLSKCHANLLRRWSEV